jgi:hypothetical protein
MPAALPLAAAAMLTGLLLLPPAATAHVAQLPLDGKKVDLRANGNPRKNKLVFETAKKQSNITILHDPTVPLQGMKLFVTASDGSRSELTTLPADFWKPMGKGVPRGWKYKDKTGTHGGVQSVILKPGSLKIKAGGENWTYGPEGPLEELWVWVGLEQEWFCSRFGGKIQKADAGYFKATKASAPAACTDNVCGNGLPEGTEQCDDGNLDDTDSCTNQCERNCANADFASTFEAIQEVVFDGYGCTSDVCHGTADEPAGDLNLLPDVSYENLVGADADAVPGVRVFPTDKNQSFLFEKLAAATFPDDYSTTGSPMPVGGALTPDHLEAIELWIEGGAPEEGVVVGTSEKLASCLPDPTPLKIDPPTPPPAGEGVQLRSTAWPLEAESEHENCFATWYDFTATSLIPEEAQVDCPGVFGPNNPSDKCFRVHRKVLAQDPQSHHSIILIYGGESGPTDELEPGRTWGPWTYRFNDLDDPRNGQSCDPTDVDPATGMNEGCSGVIAPAVGCIGAVGPPDFEPGGFGFFEEAPTTREFHISQEAYFEQEFADGVYLLFPMAATLAWNSHAFNLTPTDTTMAQYLDLYLAEQGDDLYEIKRIFAAGEIFHQQVEPFTTADYCHTWTAPQGARLTRLSSHTHRHGVNWRTWEPPNVPCEEDAFGADTCGAGPDDQLIYVSTEYSDPVQLYPDPPTPLDSAIASNRTYKFCAHYDNGSTPESPSVKRQSTSPIPTPIFGLQFGGPCRDDEVRCMDGPNKGELCGELPDPNGFCDTEEAAGDGECDACILKGGTTTEDEMFILLGDYYVP